MFRAKNALFGKSSGKKWRYEHCPPKIMTFRSHLAANHANPTACKTPFLLLLSTINDLY